VVVTRHRGKQVKTFHRTLELAREAKGDRTRTDRQAPQSRRAFDEYAREWIASCQGRTVRGFAREQRERAERAAGEERIRVARELHDIVAHSVSVMVIQAVAARRVASQDRELAREALRSVENCGREALSEMRRMVGVLHRGEIESDAATASRLSQLETLAERTRASGLPVELLVEGDPCPLSPEVELTAFRVVQEADEHDQARRLRTRSRRGQIHRTGARA